MSKKESTEAFDVIYRLNRRDFIGAAAGVVATAATPSAAATLPTGYGKAGAEHNILDVAIIGAGLAGLTAARDLRRAGCESFVVLEARDRVGGRTFNHDLGGGRYSEGGGQWIGPGQTAIADLARELGIGTFPTYYAGKTVVLAGDARVAVDLDGGFGGDPRLIAELEALARDVPSAAPWTAARAAELDKLSLGDWLSARHLKAEDQMSWNVGSSLSGGAAPSKLSLLHYLSLINSAGTYGGLEDIKNGAQETRIEGGSQNLSLAMARALGDKVRLRSPVSRIEGWDTNVVSLHTPVSVVQARRVIVAMAPPLCHQITFEPQLPEARRELQRLWPNAPMRKTVHVYSKPFWRDHGLNGTIIQTHGPVMFAYDNSPADLSLGVINAFVMPSMLPSDQSAAATMLSEIYARALGNQALHPLGYHDLDWGMADRWTLSCISPLPPGFWTRHGSALRPPVGRLIWSGTDVADMWAGAMDGAVRSGHVAALQVLQALRQG